MDALEPDGALVKVLDHLGGGDAVLGDAGEEELRVHLGAFALREADHLVHDDVELERVGRRPRAGWLQGELDDADGMRRVGREDVEREVLDPALEDGL